jgi:hypothetical protein
MIVPCLDPAFLDRADIIQFVGNPGPKAIYSIIISCFKELMQSGLIYPEVKMK